MDNFEIMREQLSNNLKLLSTQEFIRKRKEDVEINRDTFRRLTPKAFQLITYHLFSKLNAEECSKRFIGCFPVLDRRQEGEFRQTTNKWFQEITAKETNHQFPRVVPIYFQHFTPESVVCHLYLEFTNYLLIKEIHKLSSGPQISIESNDTIREQITENNVKEYERIKSEIKEETEELTDNMRHFVDTYGKLQNSMNDLLKKKNKLFEMIRQKHELVSDSDIDVFLDNRCKTLKDLVNNLKTTLMAMNELIAKNWNNYLVALEPQTDSSTDLTIDLNQWFGGNKLNSFSHSAQEFIRRVNDCDSLLQNVSENTLNKLSNISTQFSTQLEDYRKHLKRTISEMNLYSDQLRQLIKSRRAKLLANPEIIERRKWFAERIVDITKLKFKLEPKPRIAKDKEQVPEALQIAKQDIKEVSDDSPVFNSRPSLYDYSFQLMEISTCHYVAPTPSMNDSRLFSPIENKTKSVFDSN